MPKILPQIDHIIVVMLENRSFDNMLGDLSRVQPKCSLPQGSPLSYNGINSDSCNPKNRDYFDGAPYSKIAATAPTSSSTTPSPDPEETFDNVTFQLYGPEGVATKPKWPMEGFIVNYAETKTTDPAQIMQYHSLHQLPVLTTLAKEYAVSDAWFCSVPSQTWPNRAFVHAGTSNGNLNNGSIPNPMDWDVKTIFNVLDSTKKSWSVYSETVVTPSLTRIMFPKLWDDRFDSNFHQFSTFLDDCKSGNLPQYSFVEPSFLCQPTDQHPPHDVLAGEDFLYQVWKAVQSSPKWNETMLIITYDEHGGCYDHVLPPTGITPPGLKIEQFVQRLRSKFCPRSHGFLFDRLGVRVPMVVVSPWIEAGTVFRTDTTIPYDHTSILATLRDWLDIAPKEMLKSNRIAQAPTLAQVLNRKEPRLDKPIIFPISSSDFTQPSDSLPLNDLQRSLVSGTARRFKINPKSALMSMTKRQHAIDFFNGPMTRVKIKKDKD